LFEIREKVRTTFSFIIAGLIILFVLVSFIPDASLLYMKILKAIVFTVFSSVLIFASSKKLKDELARFEIELENSYIREKEFERNYKALENKLEVLEKQVKEFKILRKISIALTSTVNLEKVLKIIAEGLRENFSLKEVKVFIKDNEDDALVSLDKERLPLDEDNDIVLCFKEDRPLIWGGREYVGIPLEAKQEVVGVIVGRGDNLKGDVVREMLIYTLQAGLAIKNAQNYEIEKNFRKVLEREVKIATKKLKKAQKELVKRERLSAMGEMAAVVAHEIRNPMAFIRLVAERMIKYLKEDSKDKKYVSLLMEEIDKIGKMSENMLIFARPTPPDLKVLNLKEIVDETVLMAKKLLSGKKINIEKNVEKNLKVCADPEQLRQVLFNLVQNSIYFLEEDKDNNEKTIRITAKSAGKNKIVLTEEDNGPGIPDKMKDKVFEPFFTTRSKGTGLGLSICLRLIKGMGGDISLVDKEKGVRFDVVLPVRQGGKVEKESFVGRR